VHCQVHGTPALLNAKGHSLILIFLQVASSMVQHSESQEREKERQRNQQQLVEVIATLREEVRKLHSIPLEASQLPEQVLPVSLT
jgi:hypothetical protein